MKCPLCNDGSFTDPTKLMEHVGDEHPNRSAEIDQIASNYPLG